MHELKSFEFSKASSFCVEADPLYNHITTDAIIGDYTVIYASGERQQLHGRKGFGRVTSVYSAFDQMKSIFRLSSPIRLTDIDLKRVILVSSSINGVKGSTL